MYVFPAFDKVQMIANKMVAIGGSNCNKILVQSI